MDSFFLVGGANRLYAPSVAFSGRPDLLEQTVKTSVQRFAAQQSASTAIRDREGGYPLGTQGLLAHRPYAWIPSIKTIVGNIGVFGGMHVWTADSQTAAERAAWVAQLDEMAALKPELVIPGHMTSGTKMDASTLAFTKDYLRAFEKNLAASKNSAELIKAMKQAYPQVTDGAMSLDIGAKVNKGEMKW